MSVSGSVFVWVSVFISLQCILYMAYIYCSCMVRAISRLPIMKFRDIRHYLRLRRRRRRRRLFLLGPVPSLLP